MDLGLSGIFPRSRLTHLFPPFCFLIYSSAFILTPRPFLQIGHQLVANVEAVKIAKRKAARVEEGHLIGAVHLEEKIAEVLSLREMLEKEGQTSSDLRTILEEERGRGGREVGEGWWKMRQESK